MSGDNNDVAERNERKKKAAIIGVSSILLVAMVAAVAVGVTDTKQASQNGSSSISTSQKNADTLCNSAEYKQTCEKSMEQVIAVNDTADMKTLVKAAFNSTVTELNDHLENSTLYKELSKDEKTKDALKVCKEVFGLAIDSIKESIEKVDKFELSEIKEFAYDLKVWLTASITHQNTCLDGFDETNTTEAGKTMAQVLKSSMEMSKNALDIVNGLTDIFKTLNLDSLLSGVSVENNNNKGRKLLSSSGLEVPTWMNHHQRRLLQVGAKAMQPNVTVAQDGSGQFKTLGEALKVVPPNNMVPFVIYVKAGIYKEYVDLPKYTMNFVTLVGDGATKTIFSGGKNNLDGVTTWNTASFGVNAANFMAVDVGFENTAGPGKGQAVALRVAGDKAIFYRCNIDGNQDTLYVNAYRQFYREVNVWGTIDFIFGDAEAVFQKCTFLLRKPMPGQEVIVAAGGKDEKESPTALVFQSCKFTADPTFGSPFMRDGEAQVYLARPWKQYAKTVIIDSFIDSIYNPKGYFPFIGNNYHETCTVIEANNKGPNGDVTKRVAWPGMNLKPTPQQASEYYPGNFYQIGNVAERDSWIVASGVPYSLGAVPN